MEWPNDVVLEFLKLYEQESVIWNPQHPQHKKRNIVNDAWHRIAHSLSIDCSVVDLKKKKESLMASFRSLLTKYKISRNTGGGTDNAYTPNWFAFDTMYKFLHEVYRPRTTMDIEAFKCEPAPQEEHDRDPLSMEDDQLSAPPKKKPKPEVHLSLSSSRIPNVPEDVFDAIGKNVAHKLRGMSHQQRIIAEKIISDIMYHGQMETLTVDAHLSLTR